MTQQAATATALQEMQQVRERLARSQAKVNGLETRLTELSQQQQRTSGAEREALAQIWAQARIDLGVASEEQRAAERRLDELLGGRPTTPGAVPAPAPAPAPPTMVTVTAPADPFLGPGEIMAVSLGGMALMLPLVIVLARRLWVRGPRRAVPDLEEGSRLQRIEQAVESIALEVERIGEAQRYTTKLIAERQLDVVPRIPAQPRREPGTITPH